MAVEVILPRVDMDMVQAKISKWHVKEGDVVKAGAALFVRAFGGETLGHLAWTIVVPVVERANPTVGEHDVRIKNLTRERMRAAWPEAKRIWFLALSRKSKAAISASGSMKSRFE